MAITRLTIDGYGQLEINNCAFRRDGRIEAQCAPDATDFSGKKIENGMLVSVDAANRKVFLADDSAAKALPIGIVYSAEHLYEEGKTGLKYFALNAEKDFLPRIGYLAVGDKFTTNCIAYESEFASDSAVISALAACASSAVYGGVCDEGYILVSATAPTEGPKLKVVAKTTMPDGQLGVKFQVIGE